MNLGYYVMKAGLWLLSWLPLPAARSLGRALGRLGTKLIKRRYQVARENLRQAFPQKDAAWVEATARAHFEHLGMVALEVPKLMRWPIERVLAHTRHYGLEQAREVYRRGRGVIGLTGHIGNWEWCAAVAALEDAKVHVVARPLDNPSADRLVNGWRTRGGARIIGKSGTARTLLRCLRGGGVVGILLDQNVDWYDGEWVDFFGRPACTNKGLALLALKTRSPVLPFHCWRGDDGKFEFHYGQEIPLAVSGDKSKDVWQNTQNFTRALEMIIRQRPVQWLWGHQRWKTKPYQPWPRKKS